MTAACSTWATASGSAGRCRADPDGRAAVALHGGPGSGCAPWWRELFDPAAYRIVLFDQRGAGGSVPDAADPATDLSVNTTHHLIADLERLRAHLGIERWLVLGGSWGSTLALAYAQRHPERVTELVLFSVATTTRREVAWLTRGVGSRFPRAWARFAAGVPDEPDLATAYARALADPERREQAARDWCAWEDAHVGGPHDPRYDDPRFRLRFARLVTHYWSHAAWLGETELLDGMPRLAGDPRRADPRAPRRELAARRPRRARAGLARRRARRDRGRGARRRRADLRGDRRRDRPVQ